MGASPEAPQRPQRLGSRGSLPDETLAKMPLVGRCKYPPKSVLDFCRWFATLYV